MLITFDTDWAPDWCVRECYEICKSAGVGATFFVTDYLPVLKEIASDPMFEIGIHPNFYQGTSHGNNERMIIQHCLSLLEQIGVDNLNGISMRTHGLYQNTNLHWLIASEFPQICRDVSIFMPLVNGLKPFYFKLISNVPALLRIPYYWEDSWVARTINDYEWEFIIDKNVEDNGIKIFNFHPLHVALNTEDYNRYEDLKKCRNIKELEPSDILKYKNINSRGTRDFLLSIINMVKLSKFNTVSSITISGNG